MITMTRLALLVVFSAVIISACGVAPEQLLPTEGVKSLQTQLVTVTPTPEDELLFQSTPTPTATATATPTATATLTAIPSAAPTAPVQVNILLYEDTGYIGPWVKEVMDDMGLEYTYAKGSGDLLEHLQSEIKWSLIVIAAEDKASIQGDIWELLNQKATYENTSLIVETWSIHLIAEGKVKPFLAACGITWQKNLAKAVPVYILDPEHPIFNEPNTGIALEKPIPYWGSEAVDLMQLAPISYARILAGNDPKTATAGGMITTCFQDRVILQTFLNHDYPKENIQALWENYLTFMLRRYR
jgi:hypothetical protein